MSKSKHRLFQSSEPQVAVPHSIVSPANVLLLVGHVERAVES